MGALVEAMRDSSAGQLRRNRVVLDTMEMPSSRLISGRTYGEVVGSTWELGGSMYDLPNLPNLDRLGLRE